MICEKHIGLFIKERSFMAEKTEKKYVITNHRSGKVLASCGSSAVQMTAKTAAKRRSGAPSRQKEHVRAARP